MTTDVHDEFIEREWKVNLTEINDPERYANFAEEIAREMKELKEKLENNDRDEE